MKHLPATVLLLGLACLSGASTAAPPSAEPSIPGGFRAALTARLRTLAANPRVEILAAHFGPPLDDAGLRRLEQRLGMPLAGPLRDLFRETGEVQVVWRCVPPRPPPGTLPDPAKRYDAGPDLTTRDGIDGDIEIVPLTDLPGYEPGHAETIDGRRVAWTLLRSFDLGTYYYAAALVADPASPAPRVVLVDDYYAHVEPRSMSVSGYLALLVENLGYRPREGDEACRSVVEELGLRPPWSRS